MSSIFRKDDKHVDKPNRNTFDLSFQNNLTTKFGKLVPCFCQEVIPGDSFKIEPTFGLRFLPQVFPVQTRMRANIHFFYVRNRTIWKDWMDFIGKTKTDLVQPYLDFSNGGNKLIKESSIFDYFGLPSTVQSNGIGTSYIGVPQRRDLLQPTIPVLDNTANNSVCYDINVSSTVYMAASAASPSYKTCRYKNYEYPINIGNESSILLTWTEQTAADTFLVCDLYEPEVNKTEVGFIKITGSSINVVQIISGRRFEIKKIYGYYTETSTSNNTPNTNYPGISVDFSFALNPNYPVSLLNDVDSPYQSETLKINALPFRAYEAIYNSFYRNAENNPFLIDGVPEYNRYVKNIDGGAQSALDFELFNKNWEDDAFTTAVPTPQQGNAPLVGLTGTPDTPVRLHYAEEDGTVGTLTLQTDSNGNVISASTPYSEDSSLNSSLQMALNDAVNFGITINDLRNVNALQLWLEKNVRKGYKYPDQLKSHYGVSVSYNDLMMPEFIGGVSRDVTVNQISQTVETDTGNLGDMAGQAYVIGEGKSVSHFCDEHGFIIGILSVVPVPNYSQLIPKHLLKHDVFDYYFPEFGKIGMQPILNKEIAALASYYDGSADDVFGYQRAWYDYLANVDLVHGKFNSDFYGFLLQRKFVDTPKLGANFTTVKNEDLNNIFYVDNDEDKILGQIYFDVKAIRPIPLFGIPSIE